MTYPMSASIAYPPHQQSKDAALFVYLAWGTRNRKPLFHCDQARQAAYLAITMRLRSQFCQVMSIGGTAGQIHLIARFPPSMPISTITRMAQDAAGDALARIMETCEGRSLETKTLWERQYTTHTLCLTDAAEAQTYLRQQIISKEMTP